MSILPATVCGNASGQRPGVEPGLWHIRTVITNNGVAEPTSDEEVCVTPEEVQDLVRFFMPTPGNLPGRCSSSRETSRPEALAFRMRCSGKDYTTDMRATITFPSHQRFLLDGRSDARQRGKAIVALTRAEARRVGPCPAQ